MEKKPLNPAKSRRNLSSPFGKSFLTVSYTMDTDRLKCMQYIKALAQIVFLGWDVAE